MPHPSESATSCQFPGLVPCSWDFPHGPRLLRQGRAWVLVASSPGPSREGESQNTQADDAFRNYSAFLLLNTPSFPPDCSQTRPYVKEGPACPAASGAPTSPLSSSLFSVLCVEAVGDVLSPGTLPGLCGGSCGGGVANVQCGRQHRGHHGLCVSGCCPRHPGDAPRVLARTCGWSWSSSCEEGAAPRRPGTARGSSGTEMPSRRSVVCSFPRVWGKGVWKLQPWHRFWWVTPAGDALPGTRFHLSTLHQLYTRSSVTAVGHKVLQRRQLISSRRPGTASISTVQSWEI